MSPRFRECSNETRCATRATSAPSGGGKPDRPTLSCLGDIPFVVRLRGNVTVGIRQRSTTLTRVAWQPSAPLDWVRYVAVTNDRYELIVELYRDEGTLFHFHFRYAEIKPEGMHPRVLLSPLRLRYFTGDSFSAEVKVRLDRKQFRRR